MGEQVRGSTDQKLEESKCLGQTLRCTLTKERSNLSNIMIILVAHFVVVSSNVTLVPSTYTYLVGTWAPSQNAPIGAIPKFHSISHNPKITSDQDPGLMTTLQLLEYKLSSITLVVFESETHLTIKETEEDALNDAKAVPTRRMWTAWYMYVIDSTSNVVTICLSDMTYSTNFRTLTYSSRSAAIRSPHQRCLCRLPVSIPGALLA